MLLPSIPQQHIHCPGALSHGGHDVDYAFHTGSLAGGEAAALAPVVAAAAERHSQRLPPRLDMLLTSKLWHLAVPGLHPKDSVDTDANAGTAIHTNKTRISSNLKKGGRRRLGFPDGLGGDGDRTDGDCCNWHSNVHITNSKN